MFAGSLLGLPLKRFTVVKKRGGMTSSTTSEKQPKWGTVVGRRKEPG
jgi:hypothetical protein